MHTVYKILPTHTGAVPSDTAPAWPVTPSVELRLSVIQISFDRFNRFNIAAILNI